MFFVPFSNRLSAFRLFGKTVVAGAAGFIAGAVAGAVISPVISSADKLSIFCSSLACGLSAAHTAAVTVIKDLPANSRWLFALTPTNFLLSDTPLAVAAWINEGQAKADLVGNMAFPVLPASVLGTAIGHEIGFRIKNYGRIPNLQQNALR